MRSDFCRSEEEREITKDEAEAEGERMEGEEGSTWEGVDLTTAREGEPDSAVGE